METLNRLTNNADTAIKAYNFVKKSINSFSPEYQLANYLYNQYSNTTNTEMNNNSKNTKIPKIKSTRPRRRVASTRRFRSQTTRGLGGPGPKVSRTTIAVQTAPVSCGFSLPASLFKRATGKAQANSDIGGMADNERIVFSDIYTGGVSSGPSGSGIWGSGALYVYLSPDSISARLGSITSIYQYYAFREVTFTYIPAVATTQPGLLGFSVYQDVDANAATPTFQQILEVDPSMTAPCWGTCSMTYRHNGTRLWETSSENSAPASQYLQGLVWGIGYNIGASAVFGRMHCSGIVDVYKISFQLGSISSRLLNQHTIEEREYNHAISVLKRHKELRKKIDLELQAKEIEDLSSTDGLSKDDFENLLLSDSTQIV